jgi:hypothetical protein
MTPLIGFAPDADPTTPGIFTDCAHVIPYEAGFAGAPTPVAVNAPALSSEARGAAVATKLDGTRRIFAGTQTGLFELVSGAWTSRGTYTGSTESRWSFAQFGDTTIASNLADAMQSSSTGSFAAIATAPKAKVVVSANNNFVLAFNTNDGTYGASPDRWWCCAQNNQTDWTPNVSTQATTGRLIGVEGAIQAAKPLGDYVVAYKQRGVFLGQYAGPPVVWQWALVPGGECGAVGPEAVCDIGGAHFIVGDDNFWLFDGTRPIPIGTGVVRKWFLDNSNPLYRYKTQASYDKQRGIVRVAFPSTASTALDSGLIYHVGTKRWGVDDVAIQAQINFITPSLTIDGLASYGATIDTLPNIPLDSQYWLSGGQVGAFFNTANRLVALTGATADSSFTTGDLGDDDAVAMLERFRVRFLSRPTTATATGFYKMNEGDPLTAGPTNAINDGKFDLRQSGRFHRVRVDMTGDHRMSAYQGRPISAGQR